MQLSFRLAATPDAPRLAREAMDGWLNERLEPQRADDARLLTSELVSNAVRHGKLPSHGIVTVDVEASGSAVTVTVEQPTTTSDARIVEPAVEREGGFGLRLVDRLADSWGVEREIPGKVWFSIRAEPLLA